MTNSKLKKQLFNPSFAIPTNYHSAIMQVNDFAKSLGGQDKEQLTNIFGMFSNYVACQLEVESQLTDCSILTDLVNYVDDLQVAATQIKRTLTDLQS